MAKAPKFEGTITYVRKPIEGVTLYSGGKGEESIDEMLERLNKQDLDDIKREELTNRIKVRAAEANKKRLEVEGKKEANEKMFSVVDNKPVPDPEGEYTFAQALKTCAVAAGEKAGVGGDKVSEILGAIQPFVIRQEGAAKEAEEKKVESSVAMAAIDALSKERGGNIQAQQPLTITDLVTVLEKLNEMKSASGGPPQQRSMLDEFVQFGNAVTAMREAFGGSKSEGQSPVYVTLPGSDGKGGMPLDTFMKWDEHRWERHKDEQKFADSRENAKAMRTFVGQLSMAAAKFGPKEE